MSYNPALIPSFPTTSAMLAAYPSGAPVPATVLTLGRTVQGDGGGSQFYYKSSDTTTADNGGTIRVDGANRRWYSLVGTRISPLLFGAPTNGTDAAPAVLKTATWLNSIGGGDVLIDRVYTMAATYFPNLTKVNFIGAGGKIVSLLPVAAGPYGPLHFKACTNFKISCEVDGNYPAFAVTPSGAGLNNFCVVMSDDCRDVDVSDFYFHNSGCNNGGDHSGDGVYIIGTGNATRNINIHDGRFNNCARWAVAVLAGSGISVTNNQNTHDSTIPGLGFIDFEYGGGVPIGSGISIIGNRSQGPSKITMSTDTAPGLKGVTVIGNVVNFTYTDNGAYSGPDVGIAFNNVVDLIVIGNMVENCGLDNYHFENSASAIFADNRNYHGVATGGTSSYFNVCDQFTCVNNVFYAPGSSDFGMQTVNVTNFTVRGGSLKSESNVGLAAAVSDNNCIFEGISLDGTSGEVCVVSGGAVIFARNNSPGIGRLDAHAHTVIDNNMTISAAAGDWQLSGGYMIDPDIAHSTSSLAMTNAEFTAIVGGASTWTEGTYIRMKDSAQAAGKILLGYYRLTTGNGNVLDTDWSHCYATTS